MPEILVVYGDKEQIVHAEVGDILGNAIARTALPLEQPCAGRGTCGKCKVLAEVGLSPPDEIECKHLTPGEIAINNRLACRARIQENVRVVLAPIVIYSNKIFRASNRYKRSDVPLGLAIDLGTTTVAAFLTTLNNGEVCAGGASLNQQTVYGADVISRLGSASGDVATAERLHKLALASINQAIDSLRLSERLWKRITRITIVGNVAMHHLLLKYPVNTLTSKPFQPYRREAIHEAITLMDGIFPHGVVVSLPPLIGGFVGSDALACLAYFGFNRAPGPMAAIDLGTNGEVMVTDGKRILTASTAAGPAFEGVFISCGTRAVDGAIVKATIEATELKFDTIGGEPPIGLTGTGLISLVYELRKANLIESNGRISRRTTTLRNRIDYDQHGSRWIRLTPDGDLGLTQWDIRELQKAKGAIRAAVGILMDRLNLKSSDLQQVILTGSFGGQVDIPAAIEIGIIPPVRQEVVKTIANGAGLGAAIFLSDEGFALGEEIARYAEQVELDQDTNFISRYIKAMALSPG